MPDKIEVRFQELEGQFRLLAKELKEVVQIVKVLNSQISAHARHINLLEEYWNAGERYNFQHINRIRKTLNEEDIYDG